MGETGAFDRQSAKDGAKHDVVSPFAGTYLATLGTVTLLMEVDVHLPFYHDLLDGLEYALTFRKRDAKGGGRQLIALDIGDVLSDFLAIVRACHDLYCDLHSVSSPSHVRDCSCLLM
jgi:hypothetical protein